MRIRKVHRSSPFVFTSSDALPTVEASFPDALISNIPAVFRMKSLTESFNPAPVVPNDHHQYIELQSNLPTLNPNMAGVTKLNDNADDGSDFPELMQTPPFSAIPNKEEAKEIEKLRVCTLNRSPWDVPSFVQAFLTKPTTELAEQSIQKNSCRRGASIPNLASHTKAMAEAKQQLHEEDDDDFKKTEIARRLAYKRKAAMKTITLQEAEEEQMLESELVRVFAEEVAGLTVREAGCKLMLRNVNNIILESLPLSVQVRRAMLNSPYFVQMGDGKFVLWDNFLNSTVGRLDEEEIPSSEKRMGIHKFDKEEDCFTYKEPAKELGQVTETNLELAVPKIVRTKGKRRRRAGLGLGFGLLMNMRVQNKEKDKISICKQEDAKRRNPCGQDVEQRSYNSLYSGNNGDGNDLNKYSWDKDAVAASSDSPCYYSESIPDENGKTSQNGPDERDGAASCLIPCINGNIGMENEFRPYYRKRKPVKARSLKALI